MISYKLNFPNIKFKIFLTSRWVKGNRGGDVKELFRLLRLPICTTRAPTLTFTVKYECERQISFPDHNVPTIDQYSPTECCGL